MVYCLLLTVIAKNYFMKNFTLPAFLLFTAFLSAQTGTNGGPPPPPMNVPQKTSQVTLDFLNEMNRRSVHPKLTPDSYSGSPYLAENFKEGKVFTKGKEMDVLLRYNVLANQMEIKVNEGSKIIVLPRDSSTRYVLDGYEYNWKNLLTEDGWRKGYYVKYFEGDKVKFLGLPSISIRDAEKQTSGYSTAKPAHYKVTMEYYLAKENARLESVKVKNRDFEKYLKLDDSAEDFLDEHKIRDIADAVNFLEFYESY